MGRRAADEAIVQNRVRVNGALPSAGQQIADGDSVTLDGRVLTTPDPTATSTTIMLYKPAGYVCSRDGQGSRTVYDLLPAEFQHLKTVGRLDKESSGLLLLTNDGQLAHQLTHPSFQKLKEYQVTLDKPLQALHHQMINDYGVMLEDGPSKLQLSRTAGNDLEWTVVMHEGRNRQIRRTFDSLGYTVQKLHRTKFGPFILPHQLKPGQYSALNDI